MKKATAADYAVYFILGGMYSCSIVYIVMRSTVVTFTHFRLFFYTFLFLTLAAVVFYNIYTFFVTAAVGLLTCFPAAKEIGAYITDLYWFIRGYLYYEERFTLGVIVFVCLVAAVYVCVFLLKLNNFYMLLAFGICVLVFQFSGGYVRNSAAYILFYSCLFALAAMELNRGGKLNRALFAVVILPVCFAVSLGAYYVSGELMAYNEKTDNMPKVVNDFVYFLFNQKYYSFKSTGFGSNERLGGSVTQNDRFVMTVYSDGSPYLAGSIKTTYTGDNWVSGPVKTGGAFDLELFTAGYADALNMRDALAEAADGEFEFERGELKITGSRLATLFWPERAASLDIESDRKREIFVNAAGDMLASPPFGADDIYVYTHLIVDFSDPEVAEYLRGRTTAADPEYYELPETLPHRVYELAETLTDGLGNDYDKLKSIERHIAQFPYTLSPKPLPDGRDFVDYFLFDEPRGYCTYYASALAVLARCAGIPSRYVEGFIMPPIRSGDAYNVTNMQAHAWAEVYFDGFGWVPFEATPAYYNRFYGRPAGALGNIFSPEFFSEPDYEQYLWQYGMENEDFGLPYGQPTVRHTETETVYILTGALWFFYIICAAAACVALYFILLAAGRFNVRLRYKKIARMPENGRVHAYFRGIIKMASYFNYPVRRGETPATYADRLGKRFAFKNESVFMRDLVKIYYRGVYGGAGMPPDETALMRDCYFEFIEYINSIRRDPFSKLRQCFMV